MPFSRRSLLAFVAAAPLLPGLARAAETDPKGERALGAADAPVTVTEYYSLTCSHCASFAHNTFPRIKSELIDTGKLRYVFFDFPLDQVALAGAMAARTLPPARYLPFVEALLASQDRWAFARGIDPMQELAKMAALAGLGGDAFKTAVGDTELRNWLMQRQEEASKQAHIEATPTFVFSGKGGKTESDEGEMDYDKFAAAVAKAAD